MRALARRQLLINDMKNLERQGISCIGCAGTCCTEVANSMMVTPLETFDLFHYLYESKADFNQLSLSIHQTVQKYKLDILPPGIKKKSQFRRTYTCPFFMGSEFGCPLPRDVKPYGCLGFNRQKNGSSVDEDCWSNKEVLKEQGQLNNDKMTNEWIKNELILDWDKEYLPLALLEMIQMFIGNDDQRFEKASRYESFLQKAHHQYSI